MTLPSLEHWHGQTGPLFLQWKLWLSKLQTSFYSFLGIKFIMIIIFSYFQRYDEDNCKMKKYTELLYGLHKHAVKKALCQLETSYLGPSRSSMSLAIAFSCHTKLTG